MFRAGCDMQYYSAVRGYGVMKSPHRFAIPCFFRFREHTRIALTSYHGYSLWPRVRFQRLFLPSSAQTLETNDLQRILASGNSVNSDEHALAFPHDVIAQGTHIRMTNNSTANSGTATRRGSYSVCSRMFPPL